MKESAIILLSGGQDSTTCLYWALKNFKKVEAIGFDYGQKHVVENEAAKKIAERAGVEYQCLPLCTLQKFSRNALTDSTIRIDKNISTDNRILPNTFVDGRNLLFINYAAIYAKCKGIKSIVLGIGQTDYSGYPDCRMEFITSALNTIKLAMEYDFEIHTPLMWLNKAETWQLAGNLGILDIIKEDTITCYEGIIAEGCGECAACQLRAKGYKEFLNMKKYYTE